MLATTRSAEARARRTRLRWPSWIAPMVGTNATRSRFRFQRATCPRTRSTPRVTITCWPRAAPGSRPCSIGLLLGGEAPGLDVVHEARERLAHRAGEVGIAAYELGAPAEVEAEQVVTHQHLAVTGGAGANADGRNREPAAHQSPESPGNSLQHQREAPGLLELLGLEQQPLLVGLSPGLDFVAAECQHRLGREAQVTHDRNADLHQPSNRRQHSFASLELD